MKKLYLIQFKSSDTLAFESKVKELGSWIKYFGDNWIVETTLSSKEIYEKLTVGNKDKSIFIIQLDTSNYYGRMNTKLWEYLNPRRKK
jgi:hypothetical protein